jgi:hypothetical protein
MSEIRATTISDAAGTGPITLTKQSAAKAFVDFDGTGTVSVKASLNNSSITDNGTGDYTNNFSNAFGSVNYTHVAGGAQGATLVDVITASSSEISIYNLSNALVDRATVCLVHHGDLA